MHALKLTKWQRESGEKIENIKFYPRRNVFMLAREDLIMS